MANIGDRVGAIVSSKGQTVNIFGYGIYLGDQVPTDEVIFMGGRYTEMAPGLKNPAIRLDNGDVVFGCECWWGSEEKVRQKIGDREVRVISVQEYRRRGLDILKGKE